MKPTILLMFSFIFISGSLLGQKYKYDYIDSDIRKQILQTKPISPRLRRPDFNSPKKYDSPKLRNLDRFILYQDSSSIKYDTVRLYSDFIVAEEFPGASRFYGYPPLRKPDTRGKILNIQIDTSENVKYHLIIKDPILHTITK